MSEYPRQEDTIELLITAAKKAAWESGGRHPEDIAMAMVTAIEFSHPTILEAHRRFTSTDQA